LPSTTHLEKELLYLNLEGRAQKTQKATTPPSLARGESYILQILEKKTNPEKENNSFNRYSIEEQTPRSTKTTGILKSLNTLESKPKTVFSISRSPLTPFLTNFCKDAFSSFSYTMFECSRAYKKMFSNFSTKNTLKD
jgi:anaerobic selenocysteine-containing dehydrogenase